MNILNLKNDFQMKIKNQDVYDHLKKYYGQEHLEKILQSLVKPNLYTSMRIGDYKLSRETVVKNLLDHFQPLNNNNNENIKILSINDIIGNEKGPLFNVNDSLFKNTMFIKTTGPFKVEPKYSKILVDMACGEAVFRGSNIFAIGIVGSNRYIKKGQMVSVFSTLTPCNKGYLFDNDEYKEPTIFLGNGICHVDRMDFNKITSGIGVEMTERIYSAPPLNQVLENEIFVQHLPSIITVYQLSLQAEDKVLDMCASPGGKTTLISLILSELNSKNTVIAIDKKKNKIDKINQLCKRFNINNIQTLAKDSSLLLKENNNNNSYKFEKESFDKILLDGPCSCQGSRPCFIEESKLIDLENCASFQKRLLTVAYDLLKPGGILVYSTCTINPEENEENVAWFLSQYPNSLKLLPQSPHIGDYGLSTTSLSPENCKLVQRFDPSNESLGTIGFFISKFTKL